jgi:hypothetical protein
MAKVTLFKTPLKFPKFPALFLISSINHSFHYLKLYITIYIDTYLKLLLKY